MLTMQGKFHSLCSLQWKKNSTVCWKKALNAEVTQPTDWCAPMIPVIKRNGKVRICVDLRKLTEAVKSTHLGGRRSKIAGAMVFSKLDAPNGLLFGKYLCAQTVQG